ncbi:MAG: aminomethyl-transferring glycine dehydrogenase subunit GcvPA [Candidatus Aureabacteria bacterium]|nr:aminomethyl-transferring glycine dehydrogenase subunit GcvPA [Candidatus Auribacterota bacterium]
MKYYPHTEDDIRSMLSAVGASSLEGLFSQIPRELLYDGSREKEEEGMWEHELKAHIKSCLQRRIPEDFLLFAGAGCYEHHIPSLVDHIASRSEFYTAYTPYQPEASQGTLQAIFEFQSLMCELTGMDVSNASHYDGATSLAEAVFMILRQKKGKVLVSSGLHPGYRKVLETYLGERFSSCLSFLPLEQGSLKKDVLKEQCRDISCCVIQSPNFFGVIEDVRWASEVVHNSGGSVVVAANPMSFGIVESPGKLGADVAVGEAQPLGIPMCCGGETLGYFCAKKDYIRKMPGRIVGLTRDIQGKRGFVLTLQTREQHIRREKATSNICSNQALNALRATCYLSAVGKEGFARISERNAKNALVLCRRLEKRGVKMLFPDKPFFNEFCFRVADVDRFFYACREKGIIPGVRLEAFFSEYRNSVLTCVTETKSSQDIEAFAELAARYAHGG